MALRRTTAKTTAAGILLSSIFICLLFIDPNLVYASNSQEIVSRRHLAEGYQYHGYNYVESYSYDLSTYSVRYDKCQYVRAYDDEMAADEDSDGPLALKHFVLFRLCSTEDCEKCESSPYGKYVTEVDTYLEYTVEQQKQIFENMCENCNENCENGGACTSGGCGELCATYGNMENSGYIDASEYVQCQQLNANGGRNLQNNQRTIRRLTKNHRRLNDNNGDDNIQADDYVEEEVQLYIGPRCSGSDRRIVISLFTDENCWDPYEDESVEDVLGAPLSYYFLEHTFTSSESSNGNRDKNSARVCLTCAENDQNANQGDRNDADRVNEMCENLYDAAAKCESPTGISAGFIQTKRDNDEYENQVETEFLSCAFIDSLLWNSYTEKGEIDYTSRQDVYVRVVTKLQAIALELIAVSFVILLALVHYFQKKIAETKGGTNLQADNRAIWA